MGHLPYHLVPDFAHQQFDPNGLKHTNPMDPSWEMGLPTTSKKVRKVYALPAFSSGWTEEFIGGWDSEGNWLWGIRY